MRGKGRKVEQKMGNGKGERKNSKGKEIEGEGKMLHNC